MTNLVLKDRDRESRFGVVSFPRFRGTPRRARTAQDLRALARPVRREERERGLESESIESRREHPAAPPFTKIMSRFVFLGGEEMQRMEITVKEVTGEGGRPVGLQYETEFLGWV